MGKSKQNKNLVYAYEKGYRVTENGDVIGLRGNILKPSKSPSGYLSVTMKTPENKPTRLFIHKLQGYIKYRELIFNDGIVVSHQDFNKENNKVDNIIMGTRSESMLNSPNVKKLKSLGKPKHDHVAIIRDKENGMTYKKLMEKYNISSKGTLSFIINKALAND